MYDVWGIALWINYSFFCLDAKERTKEKIKAAFPTLLHCGKKLKGLELATLRQSPLLTLFTYVPFDAKEMRPGEPFGWKAKLPNYQFPETANFPTTYSPTPIRLCRYGRRLIFSPSSERPQWSVRKGRLSERSEFEPL